MILTHQCCTTYCFFFLTAAIICIVIISDTQKIAELCDDDVAMIIENIKKIFPPLKRGNFFIPSFQRIPNSFDL